MGEIVFIMLLIVFALFGAYCLIRLIWENRCTPSGMQVALSLESREDIRALPDTLHEIFRRLSVPSGTILILLPEDLYGDPALQVELDAFLIGYDAELLVYRREEGSERSAGFNGSE